MSGPSSGSFQWGDVPRDHDSAERKAEEGGPRWGGRGRGRVGPCMDLMLLFWFHWGILREISDLRFLMWFWTLRTDCGRGCEWKEMIQLEMGLATAVEMGRAELLMISGGGAGRTSGWRARGHRQGQLSGRRIWGQKQGRNQDFCSDPISDLCRDPRDMGQRAM